LIAYIFQDALIKQALFPSPGPNASTKKGGGKKKVDAHWELAKLLLEENPACEPAITVAAVDPKTRLIWANKIKNRLASYVFCAFICLPTHFRMQYEEDHSQAHH
ncbi:hypothetical protein K438DRAFT_1591553, partial [Mycena galopus ATCC 62051]